MGNIPDAVWVAVIMAVPTLFVYFGGRKKQAVDAQGIISQMWAELTKAQNDFTDQMEDRLKAVNERVTAQDAIIAQQNSTIAAQNKTIAAQSAKIAEQDRTIQEQQITIADLTLQIEGMGGTPVHKRKIAK